MPYRIEPFIEKSFFRGPSVRYKIMKAYTYWDDPTHGNGGGEYVNSEKVECTVDTYEEAVKMLAQLNMQGNKE